MNKDMQFMLPLDELKELSNKIDASENCKKEVMNISYLSQHRELQNSKDVAVKIKKYLDYYKIFK